MNRKLGDILIQQGIIDTEKLIAALADQRAFGGKLGRTLVDLGYLSEEQLVVALAAQLGLSTVDLRKTEPTAAALSCVPVDACERYGVLPIKVDPVRRILWIATSEPDRTTLLEVAQIAQHTVEPVLTTMSSIDRALRTHYYGERSGAATRLGEPLRSIPGEAGRSGEDELAAGAVAPAGTGAHLTDVRTILLRLERTVAAQGRAFVSLVELLQEKGIVRRGELGSRAAKKT
jgi:type IV pilus assembly protein PilB